jgi:hypothetical protein
VKITEHTYDEWQLFHLDSPAGLHILSDLHPRRSDPIDLVLNTLFFRHFELLLLFILFLNPLSANAV